MNALRTAFSYFSILPVGVMGAPDAAALAWLPLVGMTIGGLAGLAAWAASFVAPPSLVVAVAFALVVGLSGAVHVDGFLDSCDALVASVPPERRLAIMKDPHHGSFAMAGFVVACVWWIAALVAIPAALLPAALAFSGGVARLAAVQNAFVYPYGGGGAPGRTFASRPPFAVLAVCAAALAALALGVHDAAWILAGVIACGAALAAGWFAAQRLGGVLTGDVYGATIVAVDILVLTVIALRQGH